MRPSRKLTRGRVCMYYKDYLRIIRRDGLCTLQQCLVVEIKLGVKVVFLLVFADL